MRRHSEQPQVTYYPPHASHGQQGHHPGTQQPQMQPYPVMPSMGGVAKAARLVSTLVSQTVFLTILVAVAEMFAPYDYKPSTLLGRFSGGHEAAELETKQQATVDFQAAIQLVTAELQRSTAAYETLYQRMNAVTQQAYQMETIVLQMQQQVVSQGMGVQTFSSEIADLACLVSPFLQGTEYEDLNQACGVGRAIRQGQADELAHTARDHSAIVPRNVFRDLPDPAANRLEAERAARELWQKLSPETYPANLAPLPS